MEDLIDWIAKADSSGNQIEIHFKSGEVSLYSYGTWICTKSPDKVRLSNKAITYSGTTNKYLYAFLNMNRKDILTDKDNIIELVEVD